MFKVFTVILLLSFVLCLVVLKYFLAQRYILHRLYSFNPFFPKLLTIKTVILCW